MRCGRFRRTIYQWMWPLLQILFLLTAQIDFCVWTDLIFPSRCLSRSHAKRKNREKKIPQIVNTLLSSSSHRYRRRRHSSCRHRCPRPPDATIDTSFLVAATSSSSRRHGRIGAREGRCHPPATTVHVFLLPSPPLLSFSSSRRRHQTQAGKGHHCRIRPGEGLHRRACPPPQPESATTALALH